MAGSSFSVESKQERIVLSGSVQTVYIFVVVVVVVFVVVVAAAGPHRMHEVQTIAIDDPGRLSVCLSISLQVCLSRS